jgi:methylenetetrahydrofolate reductase (NADPH)
VGADGATPKLTLDAVSALSQPTDFSVAAHLTCVGSSKDMTLEVAHNFAQKGIKHIVALRGDPPRMSPILHGTQMGLKTPAE